MRKTLIVSIVIVAVVLMGSLVMATTFTDVPATSVYATPVNVVTNDNVMTGINGLFQGTQSVNRYELAQVAYNLINYIEQNPSLAKASDLQALQTVVNTLKDNLTSTNSIVVTLENQVGILTTVVEQLKKATESASSTAGRALVLANMNNQMIANMSKEIAGLTQQTNGLQTSLTEFKTESASTTAKLTQMINDDSIFLYKKIDLTNQQVAKNTTAIASLTAQLNTLSSKEANDVEVLTTQLSTTRNYLDNQINFLKNDLNNTRTELTNQISNTKASLETKINAVNDKANTATWLGAAGIAVGTATLGLFLYFVWYYWYQNL